MHVDIGPVAASSAKAWIDYARAVLDGYGLGDEPLDAEVGPEVLASFRAYLDAWSKVARRGGQFKWSADMNLEEAEYLVHAFFRVAGRAATAAEERGSRLMPPEAEAFYAALVFGLLDGIRSSGPAAAEFADELRLFWPGDVIKRRR